MNLFETVGVRAASAESLAQRELALNQVAYSASLESIDELELNPDVEKEDLERGEAVLTEVDQIIQEPGVSVEALACANDLTIVYRNKLFRRARLQNETCFSAESVTSRQKTISVESVRDGVRDMLSQIKRVAAKQAA